MLDWLYAAQLWIALAIGVITLVLGLIGRVPSDWTVGGQAVIELGLLVQLVVSLVLVANGQHAVNDTAEFFAYLITALIIPLGAVFWALIDRKSKWSTVVLGVSGLTIALMLVRMHQIWTGVYN
jgi:hypothetical protein